METTMNWIDKAVRQIEQDYDDGLIDDDEYRKQMRELREEAMEAMREEQERIAEDYGFGYL